MDKPRIIKFPKFHDRDVWLTVAENGYIPFDIKRVFYLTGISNACTRGEHAHRTSRQLLVALRGNIHIRLEDSMGQIYEFDLDKDDQALYIPPVYWGRITFEKGTIGLALASDNFSEEDYIRDYQEFKSYEK